MRQNNDKQTNSNDNNKRKIIGGDITKIQSIASITSAKLHFGKTMTNKQTIYKKKQITHKQTMTKNKQITNNQTMINKLRNSNPNNKGKMAGGNITKIQIFACVAFTNLQFTSMQLKLRTLASKL